MRIRTIKPEFWSHEDIADLAPICRLLFIGLWSMADRRGRLEDRPRRIKASVLPYDEADIDDLLNQLHAAGFIIRYTLNELELIQVVGFEKHQRINGKEAETESEYPEHTPGSEREAPGKHPGSTREAVEITGREGKGREGNMEGKGKEGKGGVGDVADEPQPAAKKKEPLSDDDWLKNLSSDPAYTGLDVPREHAKMIRWCETNGKQPSRKRLVNWLNRAERPMSGSGQRTPNQNGSKRILDTQPQIKIPEFQ